MNFQEAIQFKKSFKSEIIEKGGFKLRILVTPSSPDDLNRYCESYRVGNFTDNSAKLFCTNQVYKVRGMWSDGVDVAHKDLILEK